MRLASLALAGVLLVGAVPQAEGRTRDVGWCEHSGDPGPWQQIDAYARANGLDPGPPCLEQTTGGGHADDSLHYKLRARDVSNANRFALARLFEPLARDAKNGGSDDYPVEELYCDEIGIGWYHGKPSPYHDNPNHTHIGLREGAVLPSAPGRRRDDDR